MKKLKEYGAIIILIACLLGTMFYWFEWRPNQLRIDCGYKTANANNESATPVSADYLRMYMDVCLMKAGLSK
jgi:hypothetical protein